MERERASADVLSGGCNWEKEHVAENGCHHSTRSHALLVCKAVSPFHGCENQTPNPRDIRTLELFCVFEELIFLTQSLLCERPSLSLLLATGLLQGSSAPSWPQSVESDELLTWIGTRVHPELCLVQGSADFSERTGEQTLRAVLSRSRTLSSVTIARVRYRLAACWSVLSTLLCGLGNSSFSSIRNCEMLFHVCLCV